MTRTLGVIGTGRIGRIHIANLASMPQVSLRKIADPRIEDCRDWAASIGLDGLTEEPEDILRDPAIDTVFICSPTESHARFITEAAAAGKNIFCEKPVDLDLGRASAAVEAARAAGVRLQIGFNRRFDHNFREIRESVQAGALGTLHLVRITSRDPEPPPADYVAGSGGIFLDMTIHDFDMARYLSGVEVESVYATGSCLVDPAIGRAGDVDTAVTVLSMEGGLKVIIDNSRQAVYGYDQRVEVFGAAGSLEAGNDRPNAVQRMTKEGTQLDGPLWFFLERYAQAYRDEVREFIDALDQDGSVPVSGADGVEALRIAIAATRSLREKRVVEMDEV
jgi:myo-inositol 2-dehydrogenase/D-chiro-inositol 1-dehydrogenase